MLTLNDYQRIQKAAQEQLDKEYRDYFNKPAPILSSALVRIILDVTIEAGLVEVDDDKKPH